MNKIIRFLIVLFFFVPNVAVLQTNYPDPDSILIGNRQLPEVFLLGTFHFAYYNLDAHKTDKDKQVDILSEQKQTELRELIDLVAKFKPNKIAVETGSNTGFLMNKYREYTAGKKALGKDEIEQIGFRMMERFGIDTLYGVDAGTFESDLYNGKDSAVLRPLLDSIYTDWDFQSDDETSNAYSELFKMKDELANSMTLLEYFKYTNSDKFLNRGFGVYLTGDFKLDDHRGADALSLHWYNRNLRIFRNIQKITTSDDDRILVIYGRGHVEILKHLFECSPEFNLVRFEELE